MAARQLVSAIELAEGQQVAAMLREELTTLLSATELSGISPRIQHVIELPHGTVTLEITEKKKWKWPMTKKESEHENTLPALVDNRSLARPIGDIIDQALEQGGSEEIARAAQIEALRLAAKQRESAMDSTAANREIVEFLEQVHDASTVRDMDSLPMRTSNVHRDEPICGLSASAVGGLSAEAVSGSLVRSIAMNVVSANCARRRASRTICAP